MKVPIALLALLAPAALQAQDANSGSDDGFRLGFEIRPMVVVLPRHIESIRLVSRQPQGSQIVTNFYNIRQERTFVHGGLAVMPQAIWGDHAVKAGAIANYPFHPKLDRRDNLVAPERKALFSWIAEYQYSLTDHWSLVGGAATFRYNLEANIPPGTDNRIRISESSLRALYAGPRYQRGPLGFGILLGGIRERIRSFGNIDDIRLKDPSVIFIFSLPISFPRR